MKRPEDGPYVGLDYFAEDEAELFFGRDAERKRIISNLRASRLTLLYAQSGVGKSSLLRAGVAARLGELARRSSAEQGSPGYVPVVFSTWRDDPVAALIDAIAASVRPFLRNGSDPELRGDTLEETIANAGSLVEATPLVILDQFEEYFLYHDRDEAGERFAGELARCVGRQDLRANFLVSIREDSYSRIGDRFKTRIPNLYANYLHLDYLDERAARAAIREPIEYVNRHLSDGAERFSIEDELVDEVLRQVRRNASAQVDGTHDTAGTQRFETAYLQLVMERLWGATTASGSHMLRLETLHGFGGAETIIRAHLDDAMRDLPDEGLDAAAAAFRFLVTSAGTKIALTAGELSEFSNVPTRELEPALEHLQEARILRPVTAGAQGTRYELFHDVLGEAVVDWRKSRDAERQQRALADELAAEEQRKLAAAAARHQAQRNRLVRRAALVLSALVALLACAVVWALIERGHARAERSTALSTALAASALGKLAVDPELSILLARDGWKIDHTAQSEDALRRSLSSSLLRNRFDVGETDSAVIGARAAAFVTAGRRNVALWQREGRTRPLVPLVRLMADRDIKVLPVSADGQTAAAGTDDETRILSAERGSAVTLRGGAGLLGAALSPDGRFLVGLDHAEVTRVWDARSGERLARLPRRYAITNLVFDPSDANRIIGNDCARSPRLWSWRWRTGRVEGFRAPPVSGAEKADVTCVIAVSPDGRRAVESLPSGSARLWDLRHGRVVAGQLGPDDTVYEVAWTPDGRRVATTAGKTAMVFDGRTGEPISTLAGHTELTNTVDLSRDGELLVTSSRDGTARVWDVVSRSQLVELRGHADNVLDATFSADDRDVLTVSADGTARLWEVVSGTVLRGHDRVVDAAFSPDGARVASAGANGRARIWNLETNRSITVSGGEYPPRKLTSVAYDAGGTRIALAGADKDGPELIVANARTGKVEERLFPDDPVQGVAFSPDGGSIVATLVRGRPSIWRLGRHEDEHRAPDATLPIGQLRWAYSAEYSPDGRSIVTAGVDGVAQVFDVRSRRQRVQYRRPGILYGAHYSPDGRRVLSFGSDATAQIWEAATGKPLVVLRDHTGWVSSGAFSPDGRRVVTGSADETTRVWDAGTGGLLSIQRAHSDAVTSAAFSPDGKTIMSASADRTVRLYPCATCASVEKLVPLALQRTFRDLTPEERREYLGTR